MHATLRKLKARFDSWQGHFGSKMRQGQRRESPRPSVRRSAVRVPYMGSDRKPCQPLVSSVGRAPDQESGCDGFDSRTNSASRKTARYKESPREAGQCVIGHRTASMSAFSSTCGVDGSMSECHVVHGYRFCQSSAYWRQMRRRVAMKACLSRNKRHKHRRICRGLCRISNGTPHSSV